MFHAVRRFVPALLICAFLALALPARAANADQVTLTWHEPEPLSLVEYHGLRLPMRLVTLRANSTQVNLSVGDVVARQWHGTIERVRGQAEQRLDQESETLPDAPVFILSQGVQRGQRIVIVAISPLFVQHGVVTRASRVSAWLAGATAIDALPSLETQGGPGITAPPTNPQAANAGTKLIVTQAGIQQVTGAALGAQWANVAISQLRLWRNGVEVPVEMVDSDQDGKLGANDMLRFYAPTVGNRWNQNDTYWLTRSGGSGKQIGQQPYSAGSGAARTDALERGTWRDPNFYDSKRAGPSNDHWFSGRLLADPQSLTETQHLDLTLAPTLPVLQATATYTLTGYSEICGAHQVKFTTNLGSATSTWAESPQTCDQTRTWQRPVSVMQSSTGLRIDLASPGIDGLLIDQVIWQLPVSLNIQNGSARFTTPAAARYQLSGLGANTVVYNVTSPAAPARLPIPDGAAVTFQSAANQEYVVASGSSLHVPLVQPYVPADLSAALNAQVVYVAPTAFQAALAPLVSLRQSQGYRVAVLDPQPIYDMWSYGQVSPDAIRNFFRAAYVAGNGSLVAATLVGEGSSDPFSQNARFRPDAERRWDAAQNLNIVPPYLAPVDPWIGETACETCYAQLDGDSPLADTLPDIMLGRLSVKTPDQLAGEVAKIVRYETTRLDPATASRAVYITDNYYEKQADGTITTDPAGDFPKFAEASIAGMPNGMWIERMYFDPTAPSGPEREPNSRRAYQRTFDLINRGAALVNYIGHGSQFQWALTGLDGDPGYLFGLYDADQLRNINGLPIVLEMTCLTGAFQSPNFDSTTVDERLMLNPNGGAVAVWTSAGFGVAHGHDALQRGFYRALWKAPPRQAKLGDLAQAGYQELLGTEPSALDTLRSYVLLGDPLTRAQATPAKHTYMPLARR